MTNSDLSALSMSELKAIALELNAAPTADKRAKRAWIDAIEIAQAIVTISEPEVESTDDDTWELVNNEVVTVVPSSKPKAISVFALIFCLIGFILQTTIIAICTILKYAILTGWYVSALFGKYNPSLDIAYQCQLLAANRKQSAIV